LFVSQLSRTATTLGLSSPRASASPRVHTRYGGVYSVTLIPGDGVGKEITNSVKDIFEKANVPVEFEEFPGVSGESGPDDTEFRKSMDSLRRNKVGLKGESSEAVAPVRGRRRAAASWGEMPPLGGWSLVQEDKLSLELQSGAAIRNMGDGQLSCT